MKPPFTPVAVDGDLWLVRKPGESDGCWSYDRKSRQYVAHFGPVNGTVVGVSRSWLSPDGKCMAWFLTPRPSGWRGGALTGRLIQQRAGEKDISIPIEVQAEVGGGRPVVPRGIGLVFSADGKIEFRARMGDDDARDRVWTIHIATGEVNSVVAPHVKPTDDSGFDLGGVPVPDYLRQEAKAFGHFGPAGLAPAFLLHLGILTAEPAFDNCTAGVSRDGRHVLYAARKGPLVGVLIYGDLQTRQTRRWNMPKEIKGLNAMEFVWVD
jgi:hypothetical protein